MRTRSPSRSSRVAARDVTKPATASAVGVGIVLIGCLLSFYLVGLAMIPVGAWIWKRSIAA